MNHGSSRQPGTVVVIKFAEKGSTHQGGSFEEALIFFFLLSLGSTFRFVIAFLPRCVAPVLVDIAD